MLSEVVIFLPRLQFYHTQLDIGWAKELNKFISSANNFISVHYDMQIEVQVGRPTLNGGPVRLRLNFSCVSVQCPCNIINI